MSREPQLYRKPRKPGYIGAYNWRATTSGLFLLVLLCVAATQYIAAKFDYQTALGKPLQRLKDGRAIYQPFAWMVWGWRYSTTHDPRIRMPLYQGEMIVILGSAVAVGIFYIAAGRRSRRLMENAEDLHGSARWARKIPAVSTTYAMTAPSTSSPSLPLAPVRV